MSSAEKPQRSVAVCALGAVVVAGASFLPWGGSGRAERTSFELVGVAERLDVLSSTASDLAQLWYLLPLVGALCGLAAVTGRWVGALIAGIVVAVAGAAMAVAVIDSPVRPLGGPYVTLGGSLLVCLGVVLLLIERRGSD